MSADFSRALLKVSVGKILQTIGWHSINSTPLEILTDILAQYLLQIAKSTNDYANEFGYIEPNLDHVGLAFRDYHVNLSELEEYVTYVDFVRGPTPLPKYPIPKEDHLNFLKPGSKEVVTRPVYIYEHLPPMNPLLEANETEDESNNIKKEEPESVPPNENAVQIFKKPSEVITGEPFKRPRLLLEEEGRPTREISSVMMTTSGFLSPAREGKLPESRTPLTPIEVAPAPNSPTPPNEPPKKINKLVKKVDKKKEKVGKELFKIGPEDKIKKQTTMRDIVKLKQLKAAVANSIAMNSSMMLNSDVKISPIPLSKNTQLSQKITNKALTAARLKTSKLNTTIIPIPPKPKSPPLATATNTPSHVDKLFTEPDKKKVNIFKKISNVKNEKLENKIIKIKEEIKEESRESSPDLIIDETVELTNKIQHISNDITIELIEASSSVVKSPEKEKPTYFYDDSPPGTPSTPKTPEMISQSPPLAKEKRKRKDKSKIKKVQKQSPNHIETDTMEIELVHPKTPEPPPMIIKQEPLPVVPPTVPFPFLPNFGGPGLIPTPLNNQIFSALPFPPLNLHGFGQSPYMPPVHPGLPINMMHHPKYEEASPSSTPPPQTKPIITDIPLTPPSNFTEKPPSPKLEKKLKEHKKEKKDKLKKKNKKDKIKNKAEKKKLKEEKKDKEKLKKEKREKRKEKEMLRENNEISVPKLTLKLGSVSPRPETPDARKLNIKPVIKKEEPEFETVEEKREMSPELAKISALVTGQPKPKSTNTILNANLKENQMKEDGVTSQMVSNVKTNAGPGRPRIHPIKPKPTKLNKRQIPVKDSEGNEVWICPACGKQDDGSPMIGCDDCDAWYHWVCVGIQVPPDDNEDWYCRNCIVKKQEVLQSDKKKKRKKKEKKEQH